MRVIYQSYVPVACSLVRADGFVRDWNAGRWTEAGATLGVEHLREFVPIAGTGPLACQRVADLPGLGAIDLFDGATTYGCHRLDGKSCHLVGDPKACVTPGPTFTWALWVRTDHAQPQGTLIAEASTATATPLVRLYMDDLVPGTLAIGWRDDAGVSAFVRGGRRVSDGRWHHVAVTRDPDYLTLWVDGVTDAAGDGAGPGPTTVDELSIGALWRTVLDRQFIGGLDDVRTYPWALTPAELEAAASRWLAGPAGQSDLALVVWDMPAGVPTVAIETIPWNLIAPGGSIPGGRGTA